MNDFNQVMQSDKESERKVRERLFNPNPFALERMRIKDNHQTVSAMIHMNGEMKQKVMRMSLFTPTTQRKYFQCDLM